MINLEWLRTFKAVYEKGSMTAAADALFISQPGVSLHLASLEEHTGHKLFERMPRKLIPTERGKLLYNSVVDPLEQLLEVEQHFLKSTREDTPSVTIGMCFESFQETLQRHIPHMSFDVILEFGEYRELLQKIDKGIIDLVVTPKRFDSKEVVYTPFARENIILAAGQGLDSTPFEKGLAAKDTAAMLTWLKEQRWYGITGDNEHLRRFWQRNFGTHPDFRPNFIVPNIHSIVASLSAGPGLAVIPDFLCHKEVERGDIRILWHGFKPLTNTLSIVRRKNELHPAELDHIQELLVREMSKITR